MKKYKKKKIFIICFIILIPCITFFLSNLNKNSNETKKTTQSEQDLENHRTNIIDAISYSSKDLKGNEYKIFAETGEIDLSNTDIIYLTNVKAYIILKNDPEIVNITSDYGKYNASNLNTIFSKNVRINYIDNLITGEYMEYAMKKNLLIISKNVVYKNLDNTMIADVIELNTITKNTKIFMHNSDYKVKIKNFK